MQPVELAKSSVILQQGEIPDAAYILDSAIVKVSSDEQVSGNLGNGDFAGDIFSVQKSQPINFSVTVEKSGAAYMVSAKALSSFIRKNPGVYMRLLKAREAIFSN